MDGSSLRNLIVERPLGELLRFDVTDVSFPRELAVSQLGRERIPGDRDRMITASEKPSGLAGDTLRFL